MLVGTTGQFDVRAFDANSRPVSVTPTWGTDAPDVASIVASGVVSANSAGTTTIRVSANSLNAELSLTVLDSGVAKVVITTPDGPLFIGDARQATAFATDALDQPTDGRALRWSSSDTTVATVSSAGLIRAVGDGSANIIAVSGASHVQPAVVVVNSPPTLRITGSSTLVPGADAQLTATSFDSKSGSTAVPAIWSSANPDVAQVDAGGRVVAGRPGSTTITATLSSGVATLNVVTRTLPGRIAFGEGDRHIAIMSFDGSAPQELSAFQLDGPASVALSPDENRVAFDCATGVCRADIVSPAIHQFQLYYDALPSQVSWPSWLASDGLGVKVRSSEFAYASLINQLATGPWGPYAERFEHPRVAPAGGAAYSFLFECSRNICADDPDHILAWNASRPAILSDYHYVLTWLAYDTPVGLCSASVKDGTCKIVLPHDAATAAQSAWSPDGAHLIVALSGELWVVDADGSNLVRLVTVARTHTAAWSPTWGLSR